MLCEQAKIGEDGVLAKYLPFGKSVWIPYVVFFLNIVMTSNYNAQY